MRDGGRWIEVKIKVALWDFFNFYLFIIIIIIIIIIYIIDNEIWTYNFMQSTQTFHH